MNKILKLSGKNLIQTKKNNNGGGVRIPKNSKVTAQHLRTLAEQLDEILTKWKNYDFFSGNLVNVVYKEVVAKSNRVSEIFGDNSIESIRGARYESPDALKKDTLLLITYYFSDDVIQKAIVDLRKTAEALEKDFNGEITNDEMEKISSRQFRFLSVSKFKKIIKDSVYISRFEFPRAVAMNTTIAQVINFYRTEASVSSILEKLGFDYKRLEKLDDFTFIASPSDLITLLDKVPFLISMSCSDFSKIAVDDVVDGPLDNVFKLPIPKSSNEPVIGVLDTRFDGRVYFSDWVESENLLDKEILRSHSFDGVGHGTQVSSIIVDGPALNPELDDGCGRFRVKHFAVASSGVGSAVSTLKNILKAVNDNPDIKVWNLSLGSVSEVSPNTISYIAYELDKLQAERSDLIFVIAATNKKASIEDLFIGSPADSINSIVVNACTKKGGITTYSRHGPALSFFTKPDVCVFGGDDSEPMKTALVYSMQETSGTSYAAPWIARKLAYLMYKVGLNREEAKALIIDSTLDWTSPSVKNNHHGFGRVPVKISDVLKVSNSEIKFFVSGILSDQLVQAYKIPVPIIDGKFPYVARAVLTYFPRCNRSMGVEYTDTELDIHFGRVVKRNSRITIDCINNNTQGDPGKLYLPEGMVRDKLRKWDNTKIVVEKFNSRKRAKQVGEGTYGLKIMRTERGIGFSAPIRFAAVITLKNIKKMNVLSTFINNCILSGWLVEQINVEIASKLYSESEEELKFDY